MKSIVLWSMEIHATAPRTIAYIIPGLDPPTVIATRQVQACRCNRTDRPITICLGSSVPLLQHSTTGGVVDPQVIPGRTRYFSPGVSRRVDRNVSTRRKQGRFARRSGSKKVHPVAPGTVACIVPGLDPPIVVSTY